MSGDHPLLRGCPWCMGMVEDDDTIQEKDGVVWHARCKDLHDQRERVKRTVQDHTNLQKRLLAPNPATDCPPGLRNLRPMEEDSMIRYTMTPERFALDIPVGALANLTQDSHTRMLAMLNEWILRHKPVTVTTLK
jgi:hypothetical protein